jgi:NAD(P)-dependent dehydrogenase (short-subunit alcohol dehydrogenase family)
MAVAALGENATGIRGDVSNLDDLDQVFAAITARGRGLDVPFANVGVGEFATLEQLTPEGFDATFGINVRGTVFTVQKRQADDMVEYRSGQPAARGVLARSAHRSVHAEHTRTPSDHLGGDRRPGRGLADVPAPDASGPVTPRRSGLPAHPS